MLMLSLMILCLMKAMNYSNKIYKIEVELKRKDIKDLTNQNITFKYNRKTYLEITNTNDYNDYKKLLEKLKIPKEKDLYKCEYREEEEDE